MSTSTSNPMMTFHTAKDQRPTVVTRGGIENAEIMPKSRDLNAPPQPTVEEFDQPGASTASLTGQRTLENLFKQLPAEATGVYLMGFDMFQGNGTLMTVSMLAGLAVLLFVRIGLKASRGVLISSAIGYLLWVYAIGNGPFQLFLGDMGVQETAGIGTFLIAVYTSMTTVAANNGWIK